MSILGDVENSHAYLILRRARIHPESSGAQDFSHTLVPDDFDGALRVNRDRFRYAAQEETVHPAATM